MNLIINTAAIALLTTTALGHVHLLSPTGSDVLHSGTTTEILWEITVVHGTQNWDLHYATVSQEGPWIPIAIDLPTGDNTQGSVHTYDWIIPDTPSDSVWVRVTQDNKGGNYDDTNDLPCDIVTTPACVGDISEDGEIGVGDLLSIIDQWGLTDSPADVNTDGIVDVSDLLLMVGNWGACE
jgi:hypothetical protein